MFFVDKAGSDHVEDVIEADDDSSEESAVPSAAKKARYSEDSSTKSKKDKRVSWKKRARLQRKQDKATAAAMDGEEGAEEERALEEELFGSDLKRAAPSVIKRERDLDVVLGEAEKQSDEDEKDKTVKQEEGDDNEQEEEEEDEEDDVSRMAKDAEKKKNAQLPKKEVKAAWVDEDDEEQEVELSRRANADLLSTSELASLEHGSTKVVRGTEYQKRLRKHLETLRASMMSADAASKAKNWASLDKDDALGKKDSGDSEVADVVEEGADEDVAALLRSTARVTTGSGGDAFAPQRPTFISVSRLRDANISTLGTGTGPVCALQFHPRRPQLMMAATTDSYVRLYDVDGENNSLVASASMRNLKLEAACMLGPDPTEIIATGTQPFFYVYDIASSTVSKIDRVIGRSERAYPRVAASPSGEYIVLNGGGGPQGVILSGKTKQLVGTVRINSTLMTCATFSYADPNMLYAAGAGGDVFQFDMRMLMRCVKRFSYSGASNVTSLAVSPVPAAPGTGADSAPADRYMAVGSDNGVVDIFSGSEIRGASIKHSPTAAKSLMNLTTAADCAVFNPDAQLLAVSSRRKQNAFKLVHLPSCTVFSNWPTINTPTNYVYSTAFSPNGGYLAIGNDRGRALLFRMCHWRSA